MSIDPLLCLEFPSQSLSHPWDTRGFSYSMRKTITCGRFSRLTYTGVTILTRGVVVPINEGCYEVLVVVSFIVEVVSCICVVGWVVFSGG
jgi:hypothetical protein